MPACKPIPYREFLYAHVLLVLFLGRMPTDSCGEAHRGWGGAEQWVGNDQGASHSTSSRLRLSLTTLRAQVNRVGVGRHGGASLEHLRKKHRDPEETGGFRQRGSFGGALRPQDQGRTVGGASRPPGDTVQHQVFQLSVKGCWVSVATTQLCQHSTKASVAVLPGRAVSMEATHRP